MNVSAKGKPLRLFTERQCLDICMSNAGLYYIQRNNDGILSTRGQWLDTTRLDITMNISTDRYCFEYKPQGNL